MGETLEFYSEELNETRTLNIYLPLGYDKYDTKTYPVIYLLDGSIDDGFTYISGLAQFSGITFKTMPESIIVGVVNVDRKKDYTYPSRNQDDINHFPTSGKSGKFIDFIAKELMPLIADKYKTNGKRTIIGQAFGGLLATEILLTEPELFDNYILISPSLWWDNAFLVTANTTNILPKTKIYMAVWNRDPLSLKAIAKLMAQLRLTNKLHPEKSLVLTYDIIKDNDHGNVIRSAMYNAFRTVK
ncbi:hypothetical protein LCGC14_0066250 [marine sediment metagenome]|uniref:Esterase n=2 Tax=root TaxID=1 RepID=A0A0F9Y310_9ZZZZ